MNIRQLPSDCIVSQATLYWPSKYFGVGDDLKHKVRRIIQFESALIYLLFKESDTWLFIRMVSWQAESW